MPAKLVEFFKTDTPQKIAVVVSILVVAGLAWFTFFSIINGFPMGWEAQRMIFSPPVFLIVFIGMIALTAYVSRKIPLLRWFWFPNDAASDTAAAHSEANAPKPKAAQADKTDLLSEKIDLNRSRDVEPRAYPRGIYLDKHSADELRFRIKATKRKWRWLPFALILPVYGIASTLGPILGFRSDYYNQNRYVPASFSWMPTLLLLVVGTVFLVWLYKKFWLALPIRVTPTHINVNGQSFNREHYGGMRVGYEIGGNEAVPVGGLFEGAIGDTSLGFVGLRLQYGRWGEDLDYMVNKYHANEYIVWMNEMIATVGAPPAKDVAPDQGVRGQKF